MFDELLFKVDGIFTADDLVNAVDAGFQHMEETGYFTKSVPSRDQLLAAHSYAFGGELPPQGDDKPSLFPGWHMDDWLSDALKFVGVLEPLIELSGGPGEHQSLLLQTICGLYARAKLDCWLAGNPMELPDHPRGAIFPLPGFNLDLDEMNSLSVLGLPEEDLSIREVALLAGLSEITVRNAASPSRGEELTLRRTSYRGRVGSRSRSMSRSVASPRDALTYLLKQKRFTPTHSSNES